MILSRLQIQNYKQYAGEHDIAIPAQATIGVIGANGVGKTTLFEAIEWCLYNPTTIENRNIRPRGLGGYTRVAVTLERPDRGRVFVVERELRRSSTVASITEIAENGDEQILVQGSRPVTEYVTGTLIGLTHATFVATFFTRQKELHFFGDLKETSRRREVGKLLGLETIRIAQQAIGDDRRLAQSAADSLHRQYTDQSAGRDFTREAADRERDVADRRAHVQAATARAAALATTLGELETALTRLDALRDQDAAIERRIAQTTAETGALRDRQKHLATELDRLSALASQRTRLEPVAARVGPLREEVESLNGVRDRYNRKREIELSLREQDRRRRELAGTLRSTVEGVNVVARVEGWGWNDDQERHAADAVHLLVGILDRLDVTAAETRERQLARCRDAARELERSRTQLERFQRERRKLDREANALLAQGDPAAEASALDRERDALHERLATVGAKATALEAERDQARQLIRSLEESHFGERCPTCARPFAPGEEEMVIRSLRERIDRISGDLTDIAGETRRLRARSTEIAGARTALAERSTRLVGVRSRIQASVSHLDDQARIVSDQESALIAALGSAGIQEPPDDDALRHAALVLGQYRQMSATRAPLASIARRFKALDAEGVAAREELAPLADVTFNDEAYQGAMAAYQEAVRARTTIEQMDQELSRRPSLTSEQASLADGIAERDAALQALAKERADLDFEPARRADIRTQLDTARKDERLAVSAVHAATSALHEAELARSTLERERERIAQLAADADARRRDADDLDRMYREFTEFDRFAAERLTPLLGELTSELVREITDGRYDRVDFDSNFGIEVYDGADERFPLDTFSGGEQDAIALAARLSLSRMIGGAAANPPGFLVLDEVFGSLDRDRRTRLLTLLGTISGAIEDFRQVFVISHVDDVRSSAVFDELWRIDESGDGGSQLRSLAAGEDIGEL